MTTTQTSLLHESARSPSRRVPNEPPPSSYEDGWQPEWDDEIVTDEIEYHRSRLRDLISTSAQTSTGDGGGIVVPLNRQVHTRACPPEDDVRPPVEASATIDLSTAAKRLGYLKPDGRVKDSFRQNVAPRLGKKLGGKWIISVHKVEALERGDL